MRGVLRFVPAARLTALAVFSLALASLAEAQSVDAGTVDSLALERLSRERQIRGYELGRPTQSRSPRACTEHFFYRPTIDGIPILNGEIAIHADRQGRTIRAAENGVAREPPSRNFAIAKHEAAELAAEAVGTPAGATIHTEKIYFAAPQTTEPAFQVYVETPRGGAFEVVVSASTREPLRVTPLTLDATNPSIASRTVEPLSGWPAAEGSCPADVYPAGSSGECWTEGRGFSRKQRGRLPRRQRRQHLRPSRDWFRRLIFEPLRQRIRSSWRSRPRS